jgi:hypothetical protein
MRWPEPWTRFDTTASHAPNPDRRIRMNEMIQRLMAKTGLPEDKARAAVDAVLGFLKEKLPAPIAAQIDGAMTGGAGVTQRLGEIAAGLGGMFGKKS